jgi:hypothetical protein
VGALPASLTGTLTLKSVLAFGVTCFVSPLRPKNRLSGAVRPH